MKINGITVGTPTPRSNFNQTDPKKADYLVGKEKIVGKNENSIGPGAIALGDGAVAGCKGHYYNSINFKEKCLYISNQQNQPYEVVANSPHYNASFTTEWKVGDKFSIVNGAHYDEIGTITSIEGNRIGYDTIGFDAIQEGDDGLDAYSITVPSKPLCGEIAFGEGAFAVSDGGIAAGRFSVNFARNGRNIGDYSFNVGRDNVVAYSSATFGAFLKHLAKWGLSAGWSNETLADYAITLGGGLINPYECGLIGGWCNDPTIPDLLFGIGYGFDGVRKNAFNVNKYGDVWVDKDPTKPMGVATKQYVDNKTVIKRQVLTGGNPDIIYPNTYYVLTTNSASRYNVNIALMVSEDNSVLNEYKFRIDRTELISFYYRDKNGNDTPAKDIKGLPNTYREHLLSLDPSKTYEISIIDGFAKYTTWE